MDEMAKINKACEFIKSKLNSIPSIAVILGSGLGELTEEIENRTIIKYVDIPYFPVSTVAGHAGQFAEGSIGGRDVIMMQGRFHYYEGYDMKTVVFAVRVLKVLGIKTLIVTNAAGGVNLDFKPGDLMIIKDHINMSGANPLIGKNIDELGPRFPDMSEPYSKKLIDIAKNTAKKLNIDIKEGVYLMLTGPCYETPAEIRMVRKLGADAVGMSTVPEVITARHMEVSVLGISCITNMASGILNKPLNHKEVIETSNMVKDKFKKLISGIIADIE